MKTLQSTKQQGGAMVEFTLSMPLLILLFLAIVEFGRVFYTYNSLNKALENGARYLSANVSTDINGVLQFNEAGPDGNAFQAKNLIVYGTVSPQLTPLLPGLNPNQITINSSSGDKFQVSVNYDYTPMIGPQLAFFGRTIDLMLSLNANVIYEAI